MNQWKREQTNDRENQSQKLILWKVNKINNLLGGLIKEKRNCLN